MNRIRLLKLKELTIWHPFSDYYYYCYRIIRICFAVLPPFIPFFFARFLPLSPLYQIIKIDAIYSSIPHSSVSHSDSGNIQFSLFYRSIAFELSIRFSFRLSLPPLPFVTHSSSQSPDTFSNLQPLTMHSLTAFMLLNLVGRGK